MAIYITAFIAALLAATGLTPVARAAAIRLGAVSSPGGRHVNARTIPRLGGPALAFGWCFAVALVLYLRGPSDDSPALLEPRLLAVVAGGLFLCAIGAVDDLRGLRAHYKLAAQILAATGAFALGFRIDAIALPFFGTLPMGVFALPVTVLWIVGITNAVNLIDGLDGLAAGVAFFAAFTNFVVAYMSGSVFVAMLMAALMGAVIGFLFFNFNPARIFMGDSGSYFLGYVLATTALAGSLQQKASTAVSLLVPVLALGVPIFDTLFSMVRRFLERRPIFSPDRGHIHHRLLELGLTHRRAVMLLYGVSVVLAAGAIGVSLGRSWEVGIALCSVSIVFVALVRFLGYFEYLHLRRRQRSRFYDEKTNVLRQAVPRCIASLAVARGEQEVFAIFGDAAEACEMRVEFTSTSGAPLSWEPSGGVPSSRCLLRTTFPVGRDGRTRGELAFSWSSDREEPEPQVDILLQLLADCLAHAFERVESGFAPHALQPTLTPSGAESAPKLLVTP